jgi:hypothetical protein
MLSVYTYKSNWWGYIGKRVLIAAVAFFVITFAVSLTISSAMYPLPINVTVDGEQIVFYVYPDISNAQIYVDWLGDFFTGNWGYSLYPESFYSK